LDWEKEKTYEILSREEKLQIEMEKIIRSSGDSYSTRKKVRKL